MVGDTGSDTADEPSGDVLSTVGLILNVAGVIFVAMWLSIKD